MSTAQQIPTTTPNPLGGLQTLFRPERIREASLFFIIVMTLLFFSTQIPNYFESRTLNRISGSVMIIMVVAVGQVLVVLTRNIDLSVGSIVGFTAYFVGRQVANDPTLTPLTLVLLAMSLGALMGGINGLLTTYGRIPSIVVTLGTLAIYRSILTDYSNSKTVTAGSLPQWLSDLNRVNLFTLGGPEGGLEIRLLFSVAILAVLVFQLVLAFLPIGRRIYAIGSNPEAARVAGMPSRRITLIAFILCGALAGLGGFMFLARFGNITVQAAGGLELQVVAAVVVGGVSITGGSGTVFGVALGAFLIGTIEQSLIRLQISEFWKDATLGLFILIAVASDAVILNRFREFWVRSARARDRHNPIGDGTAPAEVSGTTRNG
jgi:rhamnose transport system permease protein